MSAGRYAPAMWPRCSDRSRTATRRQRGCGEEYVDSRSSCPYSTSWFDPPRAERGCPPTYKKATSLESLRAPSPELGARPGAVGIRDTHRARDDAPLAEGHHWLDNEAAPPCRAPAPVLHLRRHVPRRAYRPALRRVPRRVRLPTREARASLIVATPILRTSRRAPAAPRSLDRIARSQMSGPVAGRRRRLR